MGAGVARGVAGRRKGGKGVTQHRGRTGKCRVEQRPFAGSVTKVVGEKLRDAAVDRIPAAATSTRKEADHDLDLATTLGRGASHGERRQQRGEWSGGPRRDGAHARAEGHTCAVWKEPRRHRRGRFDCRDRCERRVTSRAREMIEQRIPHAPLYYRVERHDYRKRKVID